MPITCDDYRHFVRGKINPTAAIGTCGHPKRKEQVGFYPMQKHPCRAHEPVEKTEDSKT